MSKMLVGVLGATGMVGQRFIQLLADHPFFEVAKVGASEQSVDRPYGEVMKERWKLSTPIPDDVAEFLVVPCAPQFFDGCSLIFSALDATPAGSIEEQFAAAGFAVSSNAKSHRMDADVPILIPEVNAAHLGLIPLQQERRSSRGFIVTNGNCSTIILALALKALQHFGLSKVHVVTMQAISGAGYPGVASLDVTDNLIPFIADEEEKLEREPLKILGEFRDGAIVPAPIAISAHCNRIAVTDGHTECVSVALDHKPSLTEIVVELMKWNPIGGLFLPTAPSSPIIVMDEDNRPQPRLDRDREYGMAAVVGRIRRCPILGYKFVVLGHNTIRGAAGGAILNAELLAKQGYLKP